MTSRHADGEYISAVNCLWTFCLIDKIRGAAELKSSLFEAKIFHR